MYTEPCTKQQELYDSGDVPGAGDESLPSIPMPASVSTAGETHEEIDSVQPQVLNNYATLNAGSTMNGQGGASAVADGDDSDGSLDC
jgi:hypothetical protein